VIPTRALFLWSLLPLSIAVAVVAAPAAAIPVLAIDLVLATVALFDGLATRGAVSVERKVGTVQSVGQGFDVTLVVQNVGRRALQLRITDDAPGQVTGLPGSLRILPERASEVAYRLEIGQRGQHHFGPVTVRWRSPLGLWERQRRLEVQGAVRVYPDFAQLRQYELQSKLVDQQVQVRSKRRVGGENEFERLRPYVPGDSYRHIDWKATARRREFTTREYRQESNQNLIFLLDCGRMMSAQSGQLTAFDHALNAAVMMGQVALKHGDRVGLLAFDKRVRVWLPPKGGTRSGSRMIRAPMTCSPASRSPTMRWPFVTWVSGCGAAAWWCC